MKRHGSRQISSKLRHASELAAQGQTQAEICKQLGISVMTYHRWRKMELPPEPPSPTKAGSAVVNSVESSSPKTEEALLEENRRLKRIITDLLLDKMKLEEMVEAEAAGRKRGS